VLQVDKTLKLQVKIKRPQFSLEARWKKIRQMAETGEVVPTSDVTYMQSELR